MTHKQLLSLAAALAEDMDADIETQVREHKLYREELRQAFLDALQELWGTE